MDKSNAPSHAKLDWAAWGPVFFCLTLNTVVFLSLWVVRPDYLCDTRLTPSPDGIHYLRLGYNLIHHGQFSRSLGAPFVPDMMRTPGYPVFVGALDWLGGAWLIYAVQAALHAITCWLLFSLTAPFLGHRVATFSAYLLAADLGLVIGNFEPLTEPLFLCLLLVGLFYLDRGASSAPRTRRPRTALILAGIALSAAALTRLVGLWVIALCGCGLVLDLFRNRVRDFRASARALASFGLPCVLLLGSWIARNHSLHALARLTFVDSVDLVLNVGGGTYEVEFGLSREEAWSRLAEEYQLPPRPEALNDFQYNRSPAALHHEFSRVWPVLFSRYPVSFLKASAIGLFRSLFAPRIEEWSQIFQLPWKPARLSDFVFSPFSYLNTPASLSLGLLVVWQLLYASLVFLFSLAGLFFLLRSRPDGRRTVLFLALAGYTLFTIPMFGYHGEYRARIPLLPFQAVLAALALVAVGRRSSAAPKKTSAHAIQ